MPPTPLHEGLVHLLRQRAASAVDLLRLVVGPELPPHDAVALETGDLGSPQPVETRADAVLRCTHEGRTVFGVVADIQLDIDDKKLDAWPVYLAFTRLRLRQPVILLVITNSGRVADWASRPIDLGFGSGVIQPIVVGPDEVPLVLDEADARRAPELAVLSAVIHGHNPNTETVIKVALAALKAVFEVIPDSAALCHELVRAGLSNRAREMFDTLPQAHEFIDEGLRRAHASGKSEEH